MNNGNGDDSTSRAVTFSIAVDPTTQDVYVAQRDGLLNVFASDGTPKGKFSAFGLGTNNGQMRVVRGIAFDERGFMYLTVDEGAPSTRVQIFARTPDPVAGLTAAYASAAKTDVTLTWDALPLGVTPDAQTPLRDYVVEASTDGGATWAVISTPASTDAAATITGLDPAASYEFRVSAWNEAGNGDWIVAAPAEPVAALTLTKQGNGASAPTADDAISVAADSTVTFTYVVENTGNVPVTGVELSDDQLGVIAPPAGFTGTLAPGASATFTATGPIAEGEYVNVATVTSNETEDVLAEWHGFGVTTGLTIVKQGNTVVATTVDDAVHVPAHSTVTFTYVVTNNGNVPAVGVGVVDDQLGEIAAPDGFTGTLEPGASVTFTATGPVAAGAYVNVATASSEGNEDALTEWHGVGDVPEPLVSAIAITKQGNGTTAPTAADAVPVAAGAEVVFTYVVSNTDETPVEGVSVVDDQLGAIAWPAGFDGTLDIGESVTFTASGVVPAGAYVNIATGSAVGVDNVTAQWHGLGETPVTPEPTAEPTPEPSTPAPTTPAPTTAAPTSAPTLPTTGSDSAATSFIAGLAGAFLIGGAVLFGIRRRRTT